MIDFYARRYAKHAVCRRHVCVCVSVTLRYCMKTAKCRIMQLMPHDRSATLVYTDKRVARSLCHSRATCCDYSCDYMILPLLPLVKNWTNLLFTWYKNRVEPPLHFVDQYLSKADSGANRRAKTEPSTIRMCIAATAAPVDLQKHEVLCRHQSTWCWQGVEEVDAERVAYSACEIVCRFSLG